MQRMTTVPDHPAGVWGSGRRAREVMPEAIRALVIARGCAFCIGVECSHAPGPAASAAAFFGGVSALAGSVEIPVPAMAERADYDRHATQPTLLSF